MDRDSIHGKFDAVLDTAASRLGVPVHDARLLRLHGNASYALPAAGLIIRIATSPQVPAPRWEASCASCTRKAIRHIRCPASMTPSPASPPRSAKPRDLMRAASGHAVLGDWDHVATGPREWDLAQIHYMDRRFGRAGENGIDAFAAAYGWDIRTWPGLDTLIAIREIWGLRPYIRTARDRPGYRQQPAYRLDTLQSGDTQARWAPA